MSPADDALTIAASVRNGADLATAVLARCLQRIRSHDLALRCFLDLDEDSARARAEAVDHDPDRRGGPLAGVPVAWQDNLAVATERLSAASRVLEGYRSPFSATVMTRTAAAGGVPLGRTNMDEFGLGSSTETSAHGPTHNPFAHDRVPGGGNGGGAAAVAADLCSLAVGCDTGGSLRQPAALCGVTGLKPTYGRVSRHGLVAVASRFDCVGAIARRAADLATWLDAVAGVDPADPTSRPSPGPVAPTLPQRHDLRGLQLGLPWQLNGPGLDDEVAAGTQRAIDHLRDLGATLRGSSLPSVVHALPACHLLAAAEAASNLARYDGVRFGRRREALGRPDAMTSETRGQGFGDAVQLRLLLGAFATATTAGDDWYRGAENARHNLRADFRRTFADCDLLACPTSPIPAFPLGSRRDDPLAMFVCDALTVPASLAGLPAISLPCGATAGGLPIGLQLIAPPDREDLLLQVAHVFQQHSDHHLQRPLP
ncbi:MAG: Asp-tRNA(Asn)/Glu-tRNA(Gln) amidotransferase subunit GatA [Planctomycetes bacterium]|nr:Asp-tRNA(Asn)/Glu-tRNA(Gln) amidotransferase subunit GatA [Planctomycetota bacterium]